MVDSTFRQVDLNQDNRVDQGEFRNFLQQNNAGVGNGYSSSSYESSTTGLLGGGSYGGGASYGAGADLSLTGGVAGSYNESSSYSSSSNGYGAADLAGGAGYGALGLVGGGSSYGVSSTESVTASAVQTYPTDAQGLFKDSNPQIIRRPAPGGVQTYTQNIRVRFLQPPPIPPPGVSVLFFNLLISLVIFSASHYQRSATTSTTCTTPTSHSSTSSSSSSTSPTRSP
jgi:hypothetical protein